MSAFYVLSSGSGNAYTNIRLTQPVTVYEGLTLPANTSGYILASLHDLLPQPDVMMDTSLESSLLHHSTATPSDFQHSAIVQWRFHYSAWQFFSAMVDTCLRRLTGAYSISTDQINSLSCILTLIDRILHYDPSLAIYLDQHLAHFQGSGGLLVRLFLIFQHAAFLSVPPVVR